LRKVNHNDVLRLHGLVNIFNAQPSALTLLGIRDSFTIVLVLVVGFIAVIGASLTEWEASCCTPIGLVGPITFTESTSGFVSCCTDFIGGTISLTGVLLRTDSSGAERFPLEVFSLIDVASV
jgi:hypothetical protein